jgi:hypothetical protein
MKGIEDFRCCDQSLSGIEKERGRTSNQRPDELVDGRRFLAGQNIPERCDLKYIKLMPYEMLDFPVEYKSFSSSVVHGPIN